MPNQFFVDPTMGYDPSALSGLGQALRVNRLEREQAEAGKVAEANKLAMQQEVSAAMGSRDPDKVAALSVKYPEFSDLLYKQLGIDNDQAKGEATTFTRDVLTSDAGSIDQKYQERISTLKSQGRDASNTESSYADWLSNPESEMNDLKMLYAGLDKEGYKALKDLKPEAKEFKMGTGAMAGYVFDAETGSYSIDPIMKDELDKDAAEKLKTKGMLNSKDVVGVNDKVTALTKDAVAIHDSAKSLAALNETSTPTDQLAAIFKFMKSLDPTSVVREGEQNMAKRTGGPADAFVGFVNQIQGEGGLTPSAFKNMVNTSITLANSASDTSNEQLRGYLDVLSDKINVRDLEKMQARAPQRIESVGAEIQTDDLAIKWANENPDDPRSQRILQVQGK